MKTTLYRLLFLISCLSYSASAQDIISVNFNASVNLVNGNDVVEKLSISRYIFNKDLIRSKVFQISGLPKSEHIFNKFGEHAVLFDGVKFVVRDGRIISINGVNASREALAIVTEKLITLDGLQFFYSEKSNQEYLNQGRNLSNIFNADRQFFSTLKVLRSTIKHIAALAKPKTSKIAFELGIAKLREPLMDKTVLTEEFQIASLSAK